MTPDCCHDTVAIPTPRALAGAGGFCAVGADAIHEVLHLLRVAVLPQLVDHREAPAAPLLGSLAPTALAEHREPAAERQVEVVVVPEKEGGGEWQ